MKYKIGDKVHIAEGNYIIVFTKEKPSKKKMKL